MSIDGYMLPPIDPRAYDPARAEALALRFASGEPGTSLTELYRADSDAYPPPLIVKRWRSVWPAFDALMREAETARAVALMDATLPIADDPGVPAANAKNAIAVRWRMAEALAPDVFAPRRTLQGDASNPLRIGPARSDLSDAELLAIARGGDPMALLSDGGKDPTPTPHHAPAQSDGGLSGGDEGIPLPHNSVEPRYPPVDPGLESRLAFPVNPGQKTEAGVAQISAPKILLSAKTSGRAGDGLPEPGIEEDLP